MAQNMVIAFGKDEEITTTNLTPNNIKQGVTISINRGEELFQSVVGTYAPGIPYPAVVAWGGCGGNANYKVSAWNSSYFSRSWSGACFDWFYAQVSVTIRVYVFGMCENAWSVRKNAFYPSEGSQVAYFGSGNYINWSGTIGLSPGNNFYLQAQPYCYGGFVAMLA